MTTVAAEYAAHGAIDDALVQAATANEVGLAQIEPDGSVWWSDETYRLHGRPRWIRVRTLADLARSLPPASIATVRSAYTDSLTDQDLELRFTATGEDGRERALVLRALDEGVLLVHQAGGSASRAAAPVIDIREEREEPGHEPAQLPAPV